MDAFTWIADVQRTPYKSMGLRLSRRAISCTGFQRRRVQFKGVTVHQDFEGAITKKDRRRITSASGKQFTLFDDFRENGPGSFDGSSPT